MSGAGGLAARPEPEVATRKLSDAGYTIAVSGLACEAAADDD